jgi:hypothetical protein
MHDTDLAPHPVEYGFDPFECIFLLGERAIGLHLEAGGEVVPLAGLLETKEFPFAARDIAPKQREWTKFKWTRDDVKVYGKWVLAFVREHTARNLVREQDFTRLDILAVGAPRKRTRRNFEGTTDLKRTIGSPTKHRKEYSNWARNNLYAYAERLLAGIVEREGQPRKLTMQDFTAAYEAEKGPSVAVIEKFGGVRGANEHLGYPDIRQWEETDYIAWGARFFRVNGEVGDLRPILDCLSSQGRGPSPRSVIRHCGSSIAFRYKSLRELERQETEKQQRREIAYRMVAEGRLPQELLEGSEEELLWEAARERLIDYYHDDLVLQNLHVIEAAKTPEMLVRLVSKYSRAKITPGDVESTVSMLGLYDDLWGRPDDSYLRVLPEQIPPQPRRSRRNAVQ